MTMDPEPNLENTPEPGQLYQEFKDYVDEISTLRKLLKTLHYSISPEYIFKSIINIATLIISYESCLVLFWDRERQGYEIQARRNVSPQLERQVQEQIREGFFDWALKEHKPIFLPPEKGRDGMSSVIVPLSRGNTRIGVIDILTKEECTQRHLELLGILADEAAVSIANLNLYREAVLSKNYLSHIIGSMVDGVMTVNTEGVIQVFSDGAERMLQLKRDAVTGQRYEAVFPAALTVQLRHLQERTLCSKRGVATDVDYPRGKKVLPLRINSSVLHDETDSVLGILFIFSDISETRQLDELKRLDELKTNFLNNVSHELKTPLTSMKWAVDLISERLGDHQDENVKKLLEIIDTDNERLISLVTDLLDYSRIEAGKLKLERAAVNVAELVEDCIEKMRIIAERSGVRITTSLPDRLPALSLDREKLRQVINNLLSNAIKFSGSGSVVNIAMEIKKGHFPPVPATGIAERTDALVVRFVDQGIGVPAEERERIFEKFYRVRNPKVRNIQGTGLGLSICKSIIELHGGTIQAERNRGPGSTFTFIIPVKEE